MMLRALRTTRQCPILARPLISARRPPLVAPRRAFASEPPRRPTYTRFGERKSDPDSGSNRPESDWTSNLGRQWQWNFGRKLQDPLLQKITIGVLGACGVYYVYHLEKVPETGRWRFIDVSRESERAVSASWLFMHLH